MVSTLSTSLIITELVPNPGYKEIIVESPDMMQGNNTDSLLITLANYGISISGAYTVTGYALSAVSGIIAIENAATTVASGVMTIKSAVDGVYPYKRVYRIVGKSAKAA